MKIWITALVCLALGAHATSALADEPLDVLGRIHFNTNVSDFEQSRAFYQRLGFDTISGFPDANTVAMAQAIGITTPTEYDGSQGGEAGGYLLHGELIGPGFGKGVIDLIEFTIPRNEDPPYPALNRLGAVSAVFETNDLNADYQTLAEQNVEFLADPAERSDGVRFAVLKDPDGTFYELREVPGEADDAAPTQIHRIGAVIINVSDMERSLPWYAQLGFEVTSRAHASENAEVGRALGFDGPVAFERAILTHRADGSQLELLRWSEPFDATPPHPVPINHLGIHRLAFTSGDIEGDVEKLRAQGVEFISPVTPCCSGPDAWGSIVAFYDPDGTIHELAEMPMMTWLTRLMNWWNN